MLEWIIKNKEWLFSGGGVVLLTTLFVIARNYLQSISNKGISTQSVSSNIKGQIKGKWEGIVEERYINDDKALKYHVTWNFRVAGNRVFADSSARFEKDGIWKTENFKLKGSIVGDRFVKLEYSNNNKLELNFGTEVLQISYNGRSFKGWFVGFSASRESIISGYIEANKGSG